MLSLQALGRVHSLPLVMLVRLVLLGLQLYHSNLYLCDHIAFSPSVCDLSLPPSYKDVCACIYGSPCNAGKSPHLQILNLMTPE